MNTLESFSEALETTGDIQAIVRTMKALSSVSIRQYESAEAAMADYSHTVELGLMAVLRQRRFEAPSLLGTDGRAGHEALIVIGSDRGLCGGYNEKATRFALRRLNGESRLGVIGARVAARFKAYGVSPDFNLALPGSVEGLSRLAQAIIVEIDSWTHSGDVREVWVVHNRRVGRSSAIPQQHRLMPLPDSYLHKLSVASWPGRSLPQFRMNPDRLLSWLVQQRLFVMIYRALAEALVSEHASRLAAMQAAERNIDERREELSQLYRQRRQETITRELMDLLSGFEAVHPVD